MNFRFSCPKCGFRIDPSEKFVGKTVKCPRCMGVLDIPQLENLNDATSQVFPKPGTPDDRVGSIRRSKWKAPDFSSQSTMVAPIGDVFDAHSLWPSAPADLSLPQHFLMLDAARRREALDLAWGHRATHISAPLPPSTESSHTLIVGIALVAFGALLFLGSLGLLALEASEDQNGKDGNTQVFGYKDVQYGKDVDNRTSRGKDDWPGKDVKMFLCIVLAVLGLALVIVGIVFTKRGFKERVAARNLFERGPMSAYRTTLAYVEQLQDYVLKLQGLGITFVWENYESWLKGMTDLGGEKARQEASVSENFKCFTMYSVEPNTSTSGMPESSLQVMYVFSNGFISLVSDMFLNTKDTSYSLVTSDQPSLCINAGQLRLEEFHYRDIVEVQYNLLSSLSDASASVNSNATSHNAVTARRAEGELCITLVTGTRKTYPSTRSGVSSFLETTRQKMREVKRQQ
jgi:hypothetical protein